MRTQFKTLILLIFPILAFGQNDFIESELYNTKELNEIYTAEIGNSIIVSGYEKITQALEVISSPELKIGIIKYPIKAGDKLPYYGITREIWMLYCYDEEYRYPRGTVGVAYNTETKIYIPYVKNSGKGFITKQSKKGNIEVIKTTIVDKNCEDCFKKELIYNGKEGDVVKFTYREFINNMIRPAFNQDLSYDLNEGKIIGFKGSRIEVINTSNIGIEYKVQKYFE
ncbi:hypothetical protein [Psychroserpens burtonensis]|uniref:hypothetical protein n=1 Tax=Psychroserpens burtonensis TaxID=49278 RepID=UPI000685C571|nr:hypothetical protein [Psychroserpens burtonensis]